MLISENIPILKMGNIVADGLNTMEITEAIDRRYCGQSHFMILWALCEASGSLRQM